MKLSRFRIGGTMVVAALLLLSYCAAAQTALPKITVHLDPAQTEIYWTLSDVLHKVHGTFRLKGGVVVFDPATGAADGEMLVDLESGESGSGGRDRAMKKNVLETATYPQAIYHPEKVKGWSAGSAQQKLTIDGMFTIHGKDHPLELTVDVQMDGSQHVTATTHFKVPYVAWGMKDPSTFVLRVGKEVDVDVAAKGTLDKQE